MRILAAVLSLSVGGMPACAAPPGAPAATNPSAPTVASAKPPVALTWHLVAGYPHDRSAFTQGLLWHDGRLYESTGQPGQSSLREVELTTGNVVRRTELPAIDFGEGLALVGERLVQLTWRNGVTRVWDRATFAPLATFPLNGEGWGLTFDGRELVQSDGSSELRFRSPETFEVVRTLQVTRAGRAQFYLNELEFAAGSIWANVWMSDEIVRIDPASGEVTGVLDLTGLLTPAEAARADVLNGIAWNEKELLFYVTGKYWPRLFALRVDAARAEPR